MSATPNAHAAQRQAARVLRTSAANIEEMDPDLWERYLQRRTGDTEQDRRHDQALHLLIDALQAVGHLSTGLVMHSDEAATACLDMGEQFLRSPMIRHLDHCPGEHTR